MKKHIKIIGGVIGTLLLLFIGSCLAIHQQTKINEEIYNYTIETKKENTLEQKEVLEKKLKSIYKYFDKELMRIDKLTYLIADFTRLEKEEDRVFLNMEEISDFELLQLIFQYQFSEYLHYGLMYGVMEDLADKCELEFEEVKAFEMAEIEEYWEYLFLTQMNFTQGIASETEIEVAKFVATELITYIQEKYSKEYLCTLMKESSDRTQVYKINNVLEEWMSHNNPNHIQQTLEVTPKSVGVFKQGAKHNTLEYRIENIDWVLYLDNKDKFIGSEPSMNESTQTFYTYMEYFYDEITNLEFMMEFNQYELPRLTVEIYPQLDLLYGGKYYPNKKIKLNQVGAFSHEYIHFINDALGLKSLYRGIEEMRAVYYSAGFKLEHMFKEKNFRKEIDGVLDGENEFYKKIAKQIEASEKCLGRPLSYKDNKLLYADIAMHEWIELVGELPDFYEADVEKGYPEHYWMSVMNYLARTYGNEAVDTITLYGGLPDGTKKNMDDVLKEWYYYIVYFSEQDYMNYNHKKTRNVQ